MEALTSSCVDYFSARIVAIPDESVASAGGLTIRRDRFVAHGFHEDLVVTNHGVEPIEVRVELVVGADFADIHECGGKVEKKAARAPISSGRCRRAACRGS